MTPFQALYGQPPVTIFHHQPGTTMVNQVDQQLYDRNELLTQLKANLHAATNCMQKVTNAKRCHIEFQVGNWVFLKLQPYPQHTAFQRVVQKLSYKLYGPYQMETEAGTGSLQTKVTR